MATYYFNCSECGKSVSARSKYYKRYLGKFDCENTVELSKYYVCKGCRKKRGEDIMPSQKNKAEFDLHEYPKFNEIKGFITLEAIKFKSVGLGNELARKNFLENVKIALDREGIKNYNFIIENNELTGVSLDMPFIGNVTMKIDTNKEIT